MGLLEDLFPYLAALLPTAGVAFLFYLIIKYMITADREERKALAQWREDHPDRIDEDHSAPR